MPILQLPDLRRGARRPDRDGQQRRHREPLITGMILDSVSSPTAGYTTAFLLCGGLLTVAGLVFATFADPARDSVVRAPALADPRSPC
jgi:hypothetical protein